MRAIVKVRQVGTGGGVVISLPKRLLATTDIKSGDSVIITVRNRRKLAVERESNATNAQS